MDQESDVTVSRVQNQLHVLPEDPAAAAAVLAPLTDRLTPSAGAVGMLVLTSDDEAAAGIAARLATPTLRVMAATESRRAARVLRGGAPDLLLGPPERIAELQRSASLKLGAVKVVVFAWTDALDALDAVMADVPKDAARIVLARALTAEVEQLAERYAWRARRMSAGGGEPLPAVSLSYVVTSDPGRERVVRRLLDTLDPASAFVVTRTDRSRAEADALLRSLGYDGEAAPVRAGPAPEGTPEVILLYDLPHRDEELRTVARAHPSARLIALVTARQLGTLRAMAGGSVSPLVLPDAAVRARSREERVRDELRAVLDAGEFARDVLTLEPLLAEHDGIEIAAAALRLLEAERLKARAPLPPTQPAAVTRLYLNVGSVDEVRPGDLVGAITNEAGISRAELGRVDVRDRHATVEVATSVANAVVSKLTGVQIRGRRVIARIDEDKPRERPRRSGGERGERGERRGAPRGAPPPRGRPNRERR